MDGESALLVMRTKYRERMRRASKLCVRDGIGQERSVVGSMLRPGLFKFLGLRMNDAQSSPKLSALMALGAIRRVNVFPHLVHTPT